MVVENLEAAKEELTDLLGVRWARNQIHVVQLEAPSRPVSTDVTFVMSLDGPPYLELVEQRHGTVFGQLGLHHVGVWSEDASEESNRLAADGWPRETASLTPEGVPRSARFHRVTGGLRIEIVDIARSGPRLIRYLGGGSYLDRTIDNAAE